MAGTISVESEPKRGSTFTFTAHFGRQVDADAHETVSVPVHLAGLRVLVVDDNAVNGGILEQWLRGWKMDPTVVNDGVAPLRSMPHCCCVNCCMRLLAARNDGSKAAANRSATPSGSLGSAAAILSISPATMATSPLIVAGAVATS